MQYRLHRNLFLDAITKLQVTSAYSVMPLPVMLLSHVQSPCHKQEVRCLW